MKYRYVLIPHDEVVTSTVLADDRRVYNRNETHAQCAEFFEWLADREARDIMTKEAVRRALDAHRIINSHVIKPLIISYLRGER